MTPYDLRPFTIGNVSYPTNTTIAPIKTSLEEIDPFTYWMLERLEVWLKHYDGDKFTVDADSCELPDNEIVKYKLPYNPITSILEQQVGFPLVSCYKVSSITYEHTLTRYSTKCIYNITYTLPALSAAQKELMVPHMKAVEDIITAKFERPGEYFGNEYSGVQEINHQETTISALQLDDATNLYLPTLIMKYEVKFREEFNITGLSPLEGVDVSQDLDGMEDVFQTSIDFDL